MVREYIDRTHHREWLRAGGGLKVRPGWQLGERLSPKVVAALIADYRDGATTRELSERFGIGDGERSHDDPSGRARGHVPAAGRRRPETDAPGLTLSERRRSREDRLTWTRVSRTEVKTVTTGKKAASKASKQLSDKKSTKAEKSVAASDLAQAKKGKKK